ncbi:MAG: TetR/AcrR family transcriptional regulator [Paracoccaceae bacterium]
MGRKRALKQGELLDAAEAVVRRDGATRLTLDAVASEAGVSKSTVLYGCKSKDDLIEALLDRRIAANEAEEAALRGVLSGAPDAAIRARIALAEKVLTEEDRAVILSFSAALAQRTELAAPIRGYFSRRVADILDTSEAPRGALLAFFAIEGLHCLERFDVFRLDPKARRNALADIAWLAGQRPADTEHKGAFSCGG